MKFVFSFLVGIASGIAAVLLHDMASPFGALLAIAGTFTSMWVLGRKFGKRIYKLVGIVGWVCVFAKAATLGAGGELLVQGNNTGSALAFFGTLSLIVALALPA